MMALPPDQSRAAEIVVDAKEWAKVQAACRTLLIGDAKRIDGDGWSAYMAGTVLRIDVKAS